MFAVGHMAIAYLLGKGSSKPLRVKLNLPILLILSILPDIDIIYDFLTGSEIHRGPTHSIVVAAIAFIPIFIIYRKKAIPYFLALISHPLIGLLHRWKPEAVLAPFNKRVRASRIRILLHQHL